MARFKGSSSSGKHSEVSGMDRSDLYSLKREVDQLQSIVMHLLHCLANNEPPDLNQSVIREALYLPKEGDSSEVLERLRRTQATIEGTIECPACQSMVELRTGIDPRCNFCGHEFTAPGSP